MNQKHAPHHLPDTQQSVWQLAVIQLCGWTTLPIVATSILILQQNTLLGAVLTIVVGNAILWFIRLGIVAMSVEGRKSTLDISRDYLGNTGSYFIAGLLLVSTLVWFVAQTTAAANTLTQLVSIKQTPQIDQFTQMSVFLGIVSTFLCMDGVVLLRRLSSVAFPILLVCFFAIIFALPSWSIQEKDVPLSLAGVTLVLATNLGLTSDLPTFFRHSKSWVASVEALTVIQLVNIGVGICSLYFGAIIGNDFVVRSEAVFAFGGNWLRAFLVVFVFVSVICTNVANVYSASVGWEVVAPRALVGRKEYLILGLGLTTIFILMSSVFSIHCLLHVADHSLVNLCLVLILGYMIRRWERKLPGRFEQGAYFAAWLLSTGANALQFAGLSNAAINPLSLSLSVILGVMGASVVAVKFVPRLGR